MSTLIEIGRPVALSLQRGRVAGLAARSDSPPGSGPDGTDINIRSAVVVTQEFHLQPAFGGTQVPVRFSGIALPLMDGQDVTVLTGAIPGRSERHFVRLVNHSTRHHHRIAPAVRLLKPWKLTPFSGWWTLAAWGLGMLLPVPHGGLLGFVAMAGMLAALSRVNHQTCKRVDARLDDLARSVLMTGVLPTTPAEAPAPSAHQPVSG